MKLVLWRVSFQVNTPFGSTVVDVDVAAASVRSIQTDVVDVTAVALPDDLKRKKLPRANIETATVVAVRQIDPSVVYFRP